MDLKQLVEDGIKEAERGRELWIELVQTMQLGSNDYVILFPSDNREYNTFALKYMDDFLEQTGGVRAVLLTYDAWVKDNAHKYSDKTVEVADFSRDNAKLLMRFYSLYQFTDKLIIASAHEPEGRSGLNIAGKKGITLEEVFAIGVYGLKNIKK